MKSLTTGRHSASTSMVTVLPGSLHSSWASGLVDRMSLWTHRCSSSVFLTFTLMDRSQPLWLSKICSRASGSSPDRSSVWIPLVSKEGQRECTTLGVGQAHRPASGLSLTRCDPEVLSLPGANFFPYTEAMSLPYLSTQKAPGETRETQLGKRVPLPLVAQMLPTYIRQTTLVSSFLPRIQAAPSEGGLELWTSRA